MPTHEQFMHRAIELAERARGNTSPNPLVGAVIVRNDGIIAEGWHRQSGMAHAEVDAIRNAEQNQQSTQGATLYVSLEPCAHHGKTPPCTDAILAAGFSTVVYATADTNAQASGGASVLKAKGLNVIGGVCETLARNTNRFFFHYQRHKTPFVIAKFACSLDGRTATRTGNSQWITGADARHRGHVARQAVDAIVIGAQTAISDQPKLTVRNPDAHKHTDAAHPLRIVLDSQGRVPVNNAVFDNALPASTLVVTTSAMPQAHISQLQQRDVEVLQLPFATKTRQPELKLLLDELGRRNLQSLLVEGGHTVLGSFFDAALVDEVWAFIAPMLIGGSDASPSIGGIGIDELSKAARLIDVSVEQLERDIFIKGRVSYSNVDVSNKNGIENFDSNRPNKNNTPRSDNAVCNESNHNPHNKSEAS